MRRISGALSLACACLILASCGGGSSSNSSLSPTPNVDAWAAWSNNGFAGKTIVVWGNSTVAQANEFFAELAAHAGPGQELEGLQVTPVVLTESGTVERAGNIYNYGTVGATLAGQFGRNYTYSINAVCSAHPDLLIMRGPIINDVRLGQCDLTCAKDLLKRALDTLTSCSPNTAILLTTENSFLTTNVNNHNYVQPSTPEAAQEYTDILHDAVMSMDGKYRNVRVYDIMSLEYGTTAAPQSQYMGDQIHPNAAGRVKEADLDLKIIGKYL